MGFVSPQYPAEQDHLNPSVHFLWLCFPEGFFGLSWPLTANFFNPMAAEFQLTATKDSNTVSDFTQVDN
jgi:hypothetical protein